MNLAGVNASAGIYSVKMIAMSTCLSGVGYDSNHREGLYMYSYWRCSLIVNARIIFATGCTNLKWMSFVNFYLYVAGLFVFGAQYEPISIFNQLKVCFTVRACTAWRLIECAFDLYFE